MKKIIFLLLFINSSLYAQTDFAISDTITNKNHYLEEVKVAYSKELYSLKKLPTAISIVSNYKLENNKIENLKDLSSYIPNLFMPDYGSKLTSPIFIRGIGSKIGAPSVGLYIDGIPYYEKNCFDFSFTDIENIQILRGPQGTLYGRNTMGGIININTISPENYQGTKIKTSLGEYGYQEYNLSTYQKLNNKLYFSINGLFKHQDGFFHNLGNKNKRPDNIDFYNINGKLIYKHSNNFKSSIVLNYQSTQQGGYAYGVWDIKNNILNDVNYDKYSYYNNDVYSVAIQNEYKNDKFIITSNTSGNYYTDHQAIDQDFSPLDLYFVNHKQKQFLISEEATIKSNYSKDQNYRWLFGIAGFIQNKDSKSNVDYGSPFIKQQISINRFPAGTNSYSYMKNNLIKTYGGAIFHQSTYFLNNFSFTLGARLDYEKADLDYDYFTYLNNNEKKVDSKKSSLNFSEFTPKFSIKYQFSNNFVYTSVSKGYKAGGFNSIFEEDRHISFDPERSWNYELGLKTSLINNRLKMNITGFYIDWTNQQISQYVPSGRGRIQVNAGKSISKGFEFESSLYISSALSAQFAYGYTDATFTEYKDRKPIRGSKLYENIDYSDNYIPYIPKQTISGLITYNIDINSSIIDNIKTNLIYKGVGKHYWNEKNSLYQNYYYNLDMNITIYRKNLSLSVWTKNITNQKYIAYTFESMGKQFAQAGKPIYSGLSLKYSF